MEKRKGFFNKAKIALAGIVTATSLNGCPTAPGPNPEPQPKPPIVTQEVFPDDYAAFTARWICNSKNPNDPNSPSIINRIGESGTKFKTWTSPELDTFAPGAVESAKKLWTDSKQFAPEFIFEPERQKADIEIDLYPDSSNFYGSNTGDSLGASTTIYEFDSNGQIIKTLKAAEGVFKSNVIKESKSTGKSVYTIVRDTIGHEIAHNVASGGYKSRDNHHPNSDSLIPENYIWKTGNKQAFFVPEKLSKILKLVYQRPNGAPCPQEIPLDYRFQSNSVNASSVSSNSVSKWGKLNPDKDHTIIQKSTSQPNGHTIKTVVTFHKER
jgi:hypothetical protein